jgi:hypothetical protein
MFINHIYDTDKGWQSGRHLVLKSLSRQVGSTTVLPHCSGKTELGHQEKNEENRNHLHSGVIGNVSVWMRIAQMANISS